MLRPAINELLGPNGNRYSLVVATAKIARAISDQEGYIKDSGEEKAVSVAIDLLTKGKYRILPVKA